MFKDTPPQESIWGTKLGRESVGNAGCNAGRGCREMYRTVGEGNPVGEWGGRDV